MRNYKKTPGSRPYQNYSEQTVADAVDAVRTRGFTLRRASEVFNVPRATIARKVKGQHTKPVGGQCILTLEEENMIVRNIELASMWGFPLTSLDVRCIVQNYLNSKGKAIRVFKENLPGRDWMHLFLKRHRKLLSQRWCQNIKRARAQVNSKTINEFFHELTTSLKDVKPIALLNYDETNICDDPGSTKVLVRRNAKHAYKIMDSSKSSVSVMFCGTASGILLPPYVVYKAEGLYDAWTEGGPKGTRYNRSSSSWFNTTIFEDWFHKIVVPYYQKLDPDEPKAIIGDNLASHISIQVIETCVRMKIRFILLPPNSTHILQPLDVAFFRPLKTAWRKALLEWKSTNRGVIPKTYFPRLLKQTVDSMNKDNKIEKNLISGFTATGLYPLDPSAVLKLVPVLQVEEEEDLEESQNIIENAFELFLKNMYLKETQPLRKAKKRLPNVPPGQSVTNLGEEDVDGDLLPLGNQPSTSRATTVAAPRRKVSRREVLPEESASSDDSAEESEPEEEQSHVRREPIDIKSLKENDHIVAEFDYQGRRGHNVKKKFIGKILSFHGSKIKCSFLRESSKQQNIYVFPFIPDIEEVTSEQVIAKIAPLFEKRGRYTFPVELVNAM